MTPILIADDDFISLEVLKAMLSSFPLEVTTAGDGKEAISKAMEVQPRIIILDYEMPHLTGAEVCVELRKAAAFKDTPIIALTGHQSPTELNACREAGMNHTLHKPVAPEALAEIIELYIN